MVEKYSNWDDYIYYNMSGFLFSLFFLLVAIPPPIHLHTNSIIVSNCQVESSSHLPVALFIIHLSHVVSFQHYLQCVVSEWRSRSMHPIFKTDSIWYQEHYYFKNLWIHTVRALIKTGFQSRSQYMCMFYLADAFPWDGMDPGPLQTSLESSHGNAEALVEPLSVMLLWTEAIFAPVAVSQSVSQSVSRSVICTSTYC